MLARRTSRPRTEPGRLLESEERLTRTRTRISRAFTAAVVAAAAALGSAGSAPAATKWLCGPGVANDPCRPSLSTTLYRGWGVPAGRVTPRRGRDRGVDCFYV